MMVFYYKTTRSLQKQLTALRQISEAALKRCSQEKMFWKYAVNLQENTDAEMRFQ